MDNPIPIIVVWALQGVVVSAYVIFRLVTDRRSDRERHFLFPLVSNASDGMFPKKGDILGWVSYALLVLGMVGFLGILYMESTGRTAEEYLVKVAGVSLVAGCLLLGLSKIKKRWLG